jgi:hypothetical protein
MLAEILSYVPDQITIGQTCKKFYEISCEITPCKLWLRSFLKFASYDKPEVFTEEEIFKSMIKSKRRVSFIRTGAFFNDRKKMNIDDRLTKVIQHFGKYVEHLEFFGIEFHRDVAELLNLLPNLIELKLDYLKDGDVQSFDGLELKLPKLKKLSSRKCSKYILEVFNALPSGVLEDVEIEGPFRMEEDNETVNEDFGLFKNQNNIKVLETNDFLKFMNLKKMKLNYFVMQDFRQYPQNIEGQDEVWYLKVFGIYNQGFLKLICDEMKSLQHFEAGYIDKAVCPELSEVSKLKCLRKMKFELSSDEIPVNQSLITLKNQSLTDLDILLYCKLQSSTAAQIGRNCPRLKKLNTYSYSQLNVINSVIENCPNLQELVFKVEDKDHCHGDEDDEQRVKTDDYKFQEGLEHEKLKKLSIFGWCDEYQDLSKLLKCCKNLEEFTTVLPINVQLLLEILTSLPNLKSLDLQHHYICGCDDTPSNHKVSLEFVNILKTFGKNLSYFCCRLRTFEDEITEDFLKSEFKERFGQVEVKQKEKSIKWSMKK